LTPAEFLEAALLDFGFRDIPQSKAQRIAILQSFLWKEHREGKISALIVDEAHKLSLELLEEIRLLGNFESASEKLLQIVLVGQSELDELLNRENLRQLKQRISLRLAIEPIAGAEIEQYIQFRWMKAGGKQAPFSREAIAAIGQASRGIPRVINVLCDNALIQAFGEASPTVEVRYVLAVCRELQFADPLPKSADPADAPIAKPAVAAPTVNAPSRDALSLETFPMKTLVRYETVAARPSLLARLAGKLRFAQRTETA
jgi:general secretion pathway protein A